MGSGGLMGLIWAGGASPPPPPLDMGFVFKYVTGQKAGFSQLVIFLLF